MVCSPGVLHFPVHLPHGPLTLLAVPKSSTWGDRWPQGSTAAAAVFWSRAGLVLEALPGAAAAAPWSAVPLLEGTSTSVSASAAVGAEVTSGEAPAAAAASAGVLWGAGGTGWDLSAGVWYVGLNGMRAEPPALGMSTVKR
jgi:hypothetical protein